LRQQGVDDIGKVGYLLYETRGTTTLIGAGGEPGPLMRSGLFAAGYPDLAGPAERHAREPGLTQLDGAAHDSSGSAQR